MPTTRQVGLLPDADLPGSTRKLKWWPLLSPSVATPSTIGKVDWDLMSPSPGDMLGPYKITGYIGKGGMGEVYRAFDSRLNRQVAIKTSLSSFSERFSREARTIAALNHSNICSIYDVGPDYLVMELIEGQSPKGPLPIDHVIFIARQLSAALDAAHEMGIVHRDLKPANLKITSQGVLKVLDFGLAQRTATETATYTPESAPTQSALTQAGAIVGTPGYMSPEQAAGKGVDKRTDIWAFGVVLYELITGRPPFEGRSATEVLAAVVRDAPDLTGIDIKLRPILESCLQKDTQKRLRDIGDLCLLLGQDEGPVAAETRKRSWIPWSVAAIFAVLCSVFWLRSPPLRNEHKIAMSIVPGEPTTSRPALPPLVSPDGSAILYENGGRLYVRRLDSMQSIAVPGSEAYSNEAFWSADSDTVVYPTSDSLIAVQVPDGAPHALYKLNSPSRGGTLSEDGKLLVATGAGLVTPAANGDKWTLIERPPELSKGDFRFPEFLPGGKNVLLLFVPAQDPTDPLVYLATLQGQKLVDPVVLMKNQTAAHYTPAGHQLLYLRGDNLYAQELNVRDRTLEGTAKLVARDAFSMPAASRNLAFFSVARNGTVAWQPGHQALSQVTEFDRRGNVVGTTGPAGSYASLAISSDERHLLVSGWGIGWVMEIGHPGQLELPKGVDWLGWGANDATLLGLRKMDNSIVQMSSSGSGDVSKIAEMPTSMVGAPGISPDGQSMVVTSPEKLTRVSLRGGAVADPPKVLAEDSQGVFDPSISPDGHWLAYADFGAGGGVFVQPFPLPGLRRQIALDGSCPVWTINGKEILYVKSGQLISASFEENGKLHQSEPRILFSGLRFPSDGVASAMPLAVSHDGQRVFWIQEPEQSRINVVNVTIGQ